MQTRSRLWMTLGLLASGTSGCWGLTGIDHLGYQDCLHDSDCGPESPQCVAGRCVAPQLSSGGSGGGAGVSGGAGGGGAGVSGGAGGDGGAPESCSTNAECVTRHSITPYLCKNQRCVGLTTTDCPDVLGLGDGMANLIGADPIVLGAYSWLGASTQPDWRFESPKTLASYELAVNEFNSAYGLRVSGGTSGSLRPVLLVVCQARPSVSDASLQHLITTLEVPGIVALLAPADLNRAVNLASGRVLFVNPVECTSLRANVIQNGFLWHLLGSPEDYALPMAALLERTEAYLQARRAGTSDATTPLRVTLVESDFPPLALTVETLYPKLRFNGMNASENEAAGYLRRVRTQSALVNTVADALDALDELEQHPPDVILAMANGEFADQVVGRLELDWPTVAPNQPRPFYLMAPDLFGNIRMTAISQWQLGSRVVGIAAARDSNPGVYQGYGSRLETACSWCTSATTHRPSYYDAVYYLLYSVVASAGSELTGEHLIQGFLRIIDTQAPAVDMGPVPLVEQFDLFGDASHRIQLMGTMGPPNFHLPTGTRQVPISAWCLASNGASLAYQADVLRYNEESGEFDGTFPCFPGF